jgi:hypothetical protein
VLSLRDIALNKPQVREAGIIDSTTSKSDRTRLALDSNHLSARPDDSSRKHRNISNTGAEVQDSLAGPDSGIQEQPLGERRET